MAYEYIAEHFGKHFSVGQRVTHVKMGKGTVSQPTSSINFIMVKIDGIPFPLPCDPWDVNMHSKES